MKSQEEFIEYFNRTMEKSEKRFLAFPWADAEFYQNWLAQTYYFVSHSARLIALTGAHFGDEYIKFSEHFLNYIKEEVHHEKLAKMDLKKMGINVLEKPQYSVTRSLYQTQYYWIEYISAFSFYGYIFALEGFAVKFGPKIHENLFKIYDPQVLSFLRVHVNEDEDHIGMAFNLLKDIPPEFLTPLAQNFSQSVEIYFSMLEEAKKEALGLKQDRVA